MATVEAQRRWRQKNRFVKRQLDLMARKQIHEDLEELSEEYGLRGKGEAVSFAVYVTKALLQQADFNDEAARLRELFADGYHRDREDYAP